MPDESPTCVKHLLHTALDGPGKAKASRVMNSAFPADERPYIRHVFRTLGLSPPPAMSVVGSSMILGPGEVGPAVAKFQEWCPGKPQELKLIYRASRDGWSKADFFSRCGNESPWTVSLFRVLNQDTGRTYSIVGGFSSVPWTPIDNQYKKSPHAFLFMLRDGNATDGNAFQPARWLVKNNHRRLAVGCSDRDAPSFGVSDLCLAQPEGAGDRPAQSATIKTSNHVFDVPSQASFLRLDGRCVTEMEVFSVCAEASQPPPQPADRPDDVAASLNAGVEAPSATFAEEATDDIHSFGAAIACSLMEERTALYHAQAELAQAASAAAASAKALAAIYGPEVAAGKNDAVVELSVSGIRMTTLRSTLRACPESALAARFDDSKWPATRKDLDEHGRQKIDCRPSCFSKVLDVLRMRKRAAWAAGGGSDHWKKGWGETTRLGIKAADRAPFEEFVSMHFPGCERFVMDCVESRQESMV